MYGQWEWLTDVGRWSEPVAPAAVIFVLIAVLFYVISLFVRHAIETPRDEDPAVGLRRGRRATAVVMVVGLLVAAEASGLFRQVSVVPAGISLVATALHVGGIVVAAALIAAGLAVGFGARDIVASAALSCYLRSKWGRGHELPEIGSQVDVGGIRGALTRVSPLYAHIRTAEGEMVFVPTARVAAEGIRQCAGEAPPPTEQPAEPDRPKSVFD